MLWSGVGVNYKSIAKVSADIAYFKSIGLRNIRPHIPHFSTSAQDLLDWRTVAKTFHDAGFWVTWGLSANPIGSSTWDAIRTAIKAEAQICQDQNVCDDFEIGNEYELYLIDGWTEAGDLIPALKSLAAEVQGIFTRGTVSYSVCQGHHTNWVNAGKGDVDLLGLNTYGVVDASKNFFKPLQYITAVPQTFAAFGNDGSYISEFNVDPNNTNMFSTTEEVRERGIATIYDFIKDSGYTKALLYQWCPYKDNVSDSDFNIAHNNRTYRQMWNPILNNLGRRSFLET